MDVYVIRGLTNNLLGLPWIKALHLLEKLCEVNDEGIMEQYSKVFTGLGNFGNEYAPDHKPLVQRNTWNHYHLA